MDEKRLNQIQEQHDVLSKEMARREVPMGYVGLDQAHAGRFELLAEVRRLRHELMQSRKASKQHKERKEFLEVLTDRLEDQVDELRSNP